MGNTVRTAWLACALISVALAFPARAQRQWVTFDGGVETGGGATFSFSRPAPGYQPDGQPVLPDQPRFADETLFCGLPPQTLISLGLSINPVAAGETEDGTPVFVINSSTHQRLTIHMGDGQVEAAYARHDWSNSYRLDYANDTKGVPTDLLVGQTGANGGTPEQPDMTFALTNGGAVHNGLVVVGCEVLEPEDEAWVSSRVGLAFTTVDRLSGEDPWIVTAVGTPTNRDDTSRGAHWSLSSFPISDDELIVTWTDYRTTAKTGGQAYLTRFVREGGEWTSQTVLIAELDTWVVTAHLHCAGLLRHPDGRDSVIVSIGDGIWDNRLLARTLAAGGALAGATPIADTGIDDQSRVYPVSDDWTSLDIVWGGVGTLRYLRHNQMVKVVPADPEFRRLLCGADETNGPVLELSYDPDTKIPTWRTIGLPTVTSWMPDGVLNFGMTGEPGGPYLGRINAASVSEWQASRREARVLFSPDGEHWGQCMAAMTSEQRMAILHGKTAYIGSQVYEPAGFRRFDLPSWKLVRPLALGSSRDNLMREVVPTPVREISDGATITRLDGVADLPDGAPPPPCDPSNMFLISNKSEYGHLGLWYPVSGAPDVPEPQGPVLLRAWVYALGPDDPVSDPRTTAQVVMHIYNGDGDQLDHWTDKAEFESGRWMPLTVWMEWDPLDSAGSAKPNTKWLPSVELRAADNANWPVWNRYLIAWEGLYQGSATVEGFGLPAQQSGAEETAAVEGLSLGDEWTVVLTGMLPDDQWDNRVGGSRGAGVRTRSWHLPHLFTLTSGAGDSVQVLADPPYEGVRLATQVGSRERTVRDLRTIYWLRQSPVVCVVRGGNGTVTLDYSVGGSEPRRMALPESISPERIDLGPDGMWWHSVEAMPHRAGDGQILDIFYSQKLHCPADFNSDGLVNTRDAIDFLAAWGKGQLNADYNQDSFIDSRDVVAFLGDFAAGC